MNTVPNLKPEFAPELQKHTTKSYRFLVDLTEDEDGIFSAVAMNLPGTGSCGSSPEEAMKNFEESATGVLEVYAESGEQIPWTTVRSADIPGSARWVQINA